MTETATKAFSTVEGVPRAGAAKPSSPHAPECEPGHCCAIDGWNLMSVRVSALRPAARHLTEEADGDDRDIDFGSVGLYLVGLQVVAAMAVCAAASVLCCWLLRRAP